MDRKYNVLIVPAGSGMAIAAINALKRDDQINIVAVDIDPLAPGLYLAHTGYSVPRFDDPGFYPTLGKIIKAEHIDVVVPALDPILLEFAERRKFFADMGARVQVSEPEAIMATRDKWVTYNRLKDMVPMPRSFVEKRDVDVGYPVFIKPRDGSGSKDAYKVNTPDDLNFRFDSVPNPIIQEYLPGKEYTVDCLAGADGKLLVSIPRERMETKAGISVKGRIVRNERLEEMAEKIAGAIRFSGPFFFQAKEDEHGVPKLTEINPRIAGTMSLSSASGPNIHSLAVRICMGEQPAIPKIQYGLYITRYWKDICLSEEEIRGRIKRLD